VTSSDDTEHAALRLGQTDPTAYHKIGGRHSDGTPIAIGPWTFECPQVRRVVECYLSGQVLNACAGKTRLAHSDVHRNDLDERRAVDTHHDVTELEDHLDVESFDRVVFDPPFDKEQAEEHYDGRTVGRGPSGGIWKARAALANLTAPGGLVLCVGWNSVGLDYLDAFERYSVHVFRREQKPDVFLTVDRKIQQTLGCNDRSLQPGTDQSGGQR